MPSQELKLFLQCTLVSKIRGFLQSLISFSRCCFQYIRVFPVQHSITTVSLYFLHFSTYIFLLFSAQARSHMVREKKKKRKDTKKRAKKKRSNKKARMERKDKSSTYCAKYGFQNIRKCSFYADFHPIFMYFSASRLKFLYVHSFNLHSPHALIMLL